MCRRTRTRIRRNAHARPGRPAQKIRRQRLSARAQSEEQLRRAARLSKSALDNLLQGGIVEHDPAGGERLAERKRPATDREGLRFSPALTDGFALRDRTCHRRTAHQLAGANRKTAPLFSSKRPAPQRGANAGLLRPHAKYLAGDRTHHGAICERIRHKQDPFSL